MNYAKWCHRNNFVTTKIEPDYIEADNLTSNVKIGEPKVLADKEQNPDYSDIADGESHGVEIPCGLFCVAGKDLDLIDIEDLY